MATKNVTVDLTTGEGILSFPHLFKDTASKREDGSLSYDVQIIIPKSQKADIVALTKAIAKVGEAKWGKNWTKARNPLRDGDAEADELTEDGSTKGEKYPERLGCYFLNARSKQPIGVFDAKRRPITESSEVYGGCLGKINVTFYPYATNGNMGIGVGLNGVQKIRDGEAFGAGNKPVEAMFDLVDEDEDDDLYEEEVEETPAPKRRPAKKAATKRRQPEPEYDEYDEDDDLDDVDIDDDI